MLDLTLTRSFNMWFDMTEQHKKKVAIVSTDFYIRKMKKNIGFAFAFAPSHMGIYYLYFHHLF